MNNQIRVLRLLEYTGTHEDLTKHLAQRGVKEVSPAGWNCGKVTIRESFIENRLGGWEKPPDPEPKKNASFELAMAHLKRIDTGHANYLLKTHSELFGASPTMRKISFATSFGMGAKKLNQLLQEAIDNPSGSPTNPEGSLGPIASQSIAPPPVSLQAPRKSRNKTSDLDHPLSAKD